MLDDELRALVSVAPSADFQARVRTRVSSQQRRRPWFDMTALKPLIVPAAFAVAVAVAILYSLAIRDRSASPSDPLLSSTAALGFVAAAPTASAERPVTLALALPPRVGRRSAVQLDRAETQALQHLFSGPVPVAIVDASTPADVQELTIPSISIAPVVVDGRGEGVPQ